MERGKTCRFAWSRVDKKNKMSVRMMDEWLQEKVWCVLPTYDNAGTVRRVAEGCLRHLRHVLVVDDGSTDADLRETLADLPVETVRHETNEGKGAALLTAARIVRERGGVWMICVDADGQHDPDDVPRFFPKLVSQPHSIVVGVRDFDTEHVPGGSRFGRRFSNFWIWLESGARLSDSQSGFRAYPVDLLLRMKLRGRKYDFEVEVLSKAVWYGLRIEEVPIRVIYPPKAERISHFRKWRDNALLTHRHGTLMSRRVLPWPHKKLVPLPPDDWRMMIRHPRAFMTMVLKERAEPGELGRAAAVGVFIATLPLYGLHTVLILFAATHLKLNRMLAVNVQHLCSPPFVPLACIDLGFRLRTGSWIGLEELRHLADADLKLYLLDWLIGSLFLAPALAVLVGGVAFAIAWQAQRKGGTL